MYVFLKWKDLVEILIPKSTSFLMRRHIFNYFRWWAVNLKMAFLEAPAQTQPMCIRRKDWWDGVLTPTSLPWLTQSFLLRLHLPTQICHIGFFSKSCSISRKGFFVIFWSTWPSDAPAIVELPKHTQSWQQKHGVMKYLTCRQKYIEQQFWGVKQMGRVCYFSISVAFQHIRSPLPRRCCSKWTRSSQYSSIKCWLRLESNSGSPLPW